MRRLLALVLTVFCLLCDSQTTDIPTLSTVDMGGADSAAIYQERAYQEMFMDSLGKAETLAYRAYMLSSDSTMERSSLALLCYIYYREGKQEQLQLLMQTVSPDTYINMMDVQRQVERTKAGYERQYYIAALIVLLLVSGIVCFWYIRRIRVINGMYRQRIDSVRQELLNRDPDIAQSAMHSIDETKKGIDVLYAIINDQNISQMGKQEEQALLKTLPMVDAALATKIGKASSPLTPKETFFCIMEYYGKHDKQKAHSFCCSEQAIRSTKSRLAKKIDLSILHSE